MSGFVDTTGLLTRKRAIRLVVCVSESSSVKFAYRMMKAFFNRSANDEIHLVTAIPSEDARPAAVSRQRELTEHSLQYCTHHHVVVKEDDYTVAETLGRYVASLQPQLVFLGSNSLCQVLPQQRTSPASGASALGLLSSAAGGGTGGGLSSHSGGPGGPSPASTLSSSGPSSAPFVPSMALRLLPELRCCPVLLVKYNSRGAWLMGAGAGGGGGGSMKVMVDLQANSRHVLDWLFEHLTAGRDHLSLTVSSAYDEKGAIRPATHKLLTAFGVQARVNAFDANQTMLAGPASRSLPQAVAEGEPDVLVVQCPRCRGLPPSLVELLTAAKTSFLIWPPDTGPA